MNSLQAATYQMMHGVKEHGDATPTAWSSNVPFTNGFNHFKSRLLALDALVPKQKSPATARTRKKEQRDQLRSGFNMLVTGLRSFAYDNDRDDIRQLAHYTPTDINRMTATDLAAIAETLHDTVTNDLLQETPAPDLTPYGITAGSLTDLSDLIAGFNKLKGEEKAARAVPVDATKQIATMLTEVSGILNDRLDNAAVLLHSTAPEFVDQYFVTRRIDDPGHSPLALTVQVQDAANAPVARAVVTLSNGVTRKTSPKGRCQVQHLPDGSYTVTVSKQGYATKTQPVDITGGETEALVVVLG